MFDDYMRQDYSQLLRWGGVGSVGQCVLESRCSAKLGMHQRCVEAYRRCVDTHWRLLLTRTLLCLLLAHLNACHLMCRSPPRGVTLHILRALRRCALVCLASLLWEGLLRLLQSALLHATMHSHLVAGSLRLQCANPCINPSPPQ